jgi:hypothetical protein
MKTLSQNNDFGHCTRAAHQMSPPVKLVYNIWGRLTARKTPSYVFEAALTELAASAPQTHERINL